MLFGRYTLPTFSSYDFYSVLFNALPFPVCVISSNLYNFCKEQELTFLYFVFFLSFVRFSYTLHASINFNVHIQCKQGKDLPAKDLSGTSDPYVRVTLLPDKKHRLETKIKRRTLNPRWNETFYFEGFPIQKLNTRVLHLHVFDYDRFSRDDSIGEVFLPLCQVSCIHKIIIFINCDTEYEPKITQIVGNTREKARIIYNRIKKREHSRKIVEQIYR